MGGTGPFGMVPGTIGMPDPRGDLAKAFPQLGQAQGAAGSDILAKLGGQISPGTMAALQNAAATFGVKTGMPGSGLQWNNLFGNIAGFAENQAQQGIQDLNQFLPMVSQTQTVPPALQAEIASQNALNLAAPTPSAQAKYQQDLFGGYANALRGRTGGGSPAAPAAPLTRPTWASDVPNPPFVPSPIYDPSAGMGLTYGGVTHTSPPAYFDPTKPYGGGTTTGTSITGDPSLDQWLSENYGADFFGPSSGATGSFYAGPAMSGATGAPGGMGVSPGGLSSMSDSELMSMFGLDPSEFYGGGGGTDVTAPAGGGYYGTGGFDTGSYDFGYDPSLDYGGF